ncbi:hypothetical protein R1sor_006460 [Riccia sorocarpa]|uniref:FCP1 homology domain-containing protein n=1 Tax=Riccia sorocarpa TaxID=122646 RepID=A0ABD3HTX4_9MARC
MEEIGAFSSQPPEELVQAVADLEARRNNLEKTLTRMSTIEDPRPRLVHPETTMGKVLMLDLNGLLVRFCEQEDADAARAFGHHPVQLTPRALYLKRFARLYHYNLTIRDVLLVDDSVKKNSTNRPFSAIHLRSFTPWIEEHAPHKDQFLCGTLLSWLQAWRQSTIPTLTYVRDHYREIGAQDPIEGLRLY